MSDEFELFSLKGPTGWLPEPSEVERALAEIPPPPRALWLKPGGALALFTVAIPLGAVLPLVTIGLIGKQPFGYVLVLFLISEWAIGTAATGWVLTWRQRRFLKFGRPGIAVISDTTSMGRGTRLDYKLRGLDGDWRAGYSCGLRGSLRAPECSSLVAAFFDADHDDRHLLEAASYFSVRREG